MNECLSGLYTDMYQLTMAQAYFIDGTMGKRAVFDYFFRTIPFQGGYVIFAGLEDLLDFLEGFSFSPDDIEYLRSLGFRDGFLKEIEGFRFRGAVYSAREGETVFPGEPVIRVEGRLIETQVVESGLLNIVNFESLIASKAARIRSVAGRRHISEFGMRRAHSLASIHAARAAVIGGCDSTSNVLAARRYGLRPVGTMAHSYIESYKDELTAFRKFASSNPENCVLLVDTYDTLKSGLPNAIRTAKEMESRGQKLSGIRLDSGDLAYLAWAARQTLDSAGLGYVKIVASNLLDEHLVRSLLAQGAPIDIFGIGTQLATGAPDASLDGVYKLAEIDGRPRLKLSDSLSKTTLPGRKKVVRCSDREAFFRADAVCLASEDSARRMVHPYEPGQELDLTPFAAEELLAEVMEDGKRTGPPLDVPSIAAYAASRLQALPEEHKRLENPHIYKVGLSVGLAALRDELSGRPPKED
ncbi:MAG: nicotinate phosphoribosyltransferase [Candidatus Aminicenantales bacterium]